MYTFQYNKKYYYSVYVSFFGEFMQNEILSLRAKQQAIKKFREQAKSESLTQGDFLEKILNVYLGIPIENSSIPFKIALFWINNLDKNDKNLDKKIYSGYGELLYSSSIFDYYGITYSNGSSKQMSAHTSENEYKNHHSHICTELCFPKISFYKAWSVVDSDVKKQQLQETFNIKDTQNFHYISAFRVFKEIENGVPVITVNEQMYFINNEKYHKNLAEESMNAASGKSDSNEVLFAQQLDLAVSSMYRIANLSEGEKKLRLYRAYLNPFDRETLRNIFKPTFSKSDGDFEDILAKYSIFSQE